MTWHYKYDIVKCGKLKCIIYYYWFRLDATSDKLRHQYEGQLCKYTNVMKGWQYRWFVLYPEAGILHYYLVSIIFTWILIHFSLLLTIGACKICLFAHPWTPNPVRISLKLQLLTGTTFPPSPTSFMLTSTLVVI